MDRNLVAGLLHASSSLGIAESAVATATSGRRELNGRLRVLAASNAMELAACRAMLSRAASLVDEDGGELVELFAETQATKTFVNETAGRIVDRALTLTGGAGYLNGHPLARAYRDVRAGGFMHPLAANRAYDLLGDVALGREVALR
jgi:alkylation response protein AidB-like acyl-CoA dehydrogenase